MTVVDFLSSILIELFKCHALQKKFIKSTQQNVFICLLRIHRALHQTWTQQQFIVGAKAEKVPR